MGRGLLLSIARAAVRIGIVGMCGKGPPAVCIFGRGWGMGIGKATPPYVFLGGVGIGKARRRM